MCKVAKYEIVGPKPKVEGRLPEPVTNLSIYISYSAE